MTSSAVTDRTPGQGQRSVAFSVLIGLTTLVILLQGL